MADFGLADPVDAAETLFDLVGIPGQVVVDHQVAALKVHTFSGCVVGNQHQHVAVLHEPLDDLAPLFPRHAAMDHIDRIRIAEPSADLVDQVMERVLRLGEDDQLATIAVGIDHEVIVENTIELRPFGVEARTQDP